MNDVDKMNVAYEQAKLALAVDEIPVGCAIFKGDKLIACGYNMKEIEKNAVLHAEIIAIDSACRVLKSWRLNECTLYVTLKPCMMCLGAIIESRIKNVYYGSERKGEQMYDKNLVNSFVSMNCLYDDKCSKILSDFFKKKRKK